MLEISLIVMTLVGLVAAFLWWHGPDIPRD
jgi:hypothetical protein